MRWLELKVPPPIVTLVCGGLAWVCARETPRLMLAFAGRQLVAVAFVAAGVTLGVAGLLVFRRARTTVDPHQPHRTSVLVERGPYRFTRNPMYLGLVLVLIGLCVFLANPLALLAVVFFIAYITRFQIIPEERALLLKFGESYARYVQAVRRWL